MTTEHRAGLSGAFWAYGHNGQSKGWDRLGNGALLNAAEEAGSDLLLSTDGGIRYQQNLAGRKIAVVVLTGGTKWPRVRLQIDSINAAVAAATPGDHPLNTPGEQKAVTKSQTIFRPRSQPLTPANRPQPQTARAL